MREITVTELACNLYQILDKVESMGEEILIVRNKHQIARIMPGAVYLTALEVMADLYNTLPEDAAAGWFADSRQPLSRADEAGEAPGYVDEMRDPWDS